jgi:hypothetical protein
MKFQTCLNVYERVQPFSESPNKTTPEFSESFISLIILYSNFVDVEGAKMLKTGKEF